MNLTLTEGTSVVAPLRPAASPESYLSVAVAETSCTTYFLV